MKYVISDPFTLQTEVKKAYLLCRKSLLTDKEFVDVIGEALHRTTNMPEAECWHHD